MRSNTNRGTELSTSAVADIAFLLLVFFMVTTEIKDEKGLTLLLPVINSDTAPVMERNVFNVQINSKDQFLIEGEPRASIENLREELKHFIMNYGKDSKSSENPEKAVISLKTDRGTSYKVYVAALDEIQAAYYELYAEQAGISASQFRKLDLNKKQDQLLNEKGKNGIPMNISLSEPTRIAN